jgi:hypothetical protein
MNKKKGQLPTKLCPICHKPFEWRKKWAKNWENVVYCSERCRRESGREAKRQRTKLNLTGGRGTSM